MPIHVGFEVGCDEVLTPVDHIVADRDDNVRVNGAGKDNDIDAIFCRFKVVVDWNQANEEGR